MSKIEVPTGGDSLYNPTGDKCMKSETVSRALQVMMMVGGLLALSCPRGWAAKVPTVLTYSETYADKVACTGNSTDGYDCWTYGGGKFTIKAVIT
jgi:hypothetical protein